MNIFDDVSIETDSRRLRDEQFRQSQKMELVGRLTSGVAHDFNNLLTVILGYSELLIQREHEDGTRGCLEEIKKAAERASVLTNQLLSFCRKQLPAQRVLDLNARVRDMEKMVRRLIGEEIQMVTSLAPDLYSVCADPGQIEQVIVNFAVNARDAMAAGGTLTITTENVDAAEAECDADVPAGPYAVLTVRDTGCGMDAATLARIFEPFFTTKEAGKGTGLGLANIRDIVRQCGGHVSVASSPGQGSTFRVYLPATVEARSQLPTSPELLTEHSYVSEPARAEGELVGAADEVF